MATAAGLGQPSRGATMRISDNGRGLQTPEGRRPRMGLGLRNMEERIEQLDGTLRILSSKSGGTTIEAQVPLTHILPPTAKSSAKLTDTPPKERGAA